MLCQKNVFDKLRLKLWNNMRAQEEAIFAEKQEKYFLLKSHGECCLDTYLSFLFLIHNGITLC